MKIKHLLVGISLCAFFVVSCSQLVGPSKSPTDQETLKKVTLSVETDLSRGQGVLVTETGAKIDILSKEGEDGATVACVEALDLVVVDEGSSAKSFAAVGPKESSVKALVFGMRSDGWPGVWQVLFDGTILAVQDAERRFSSKLMDSSECGGGIRGLFGWTYKPIAMRSDGKSGALIVGEALNKRGFHWGKHVIEPGTTVAVYWRLEKHRNSRFYWVAPAKVIGTPADSTNPANSPKEPPKPFKAGKHWPRGIISGLRQFFLEWYEDYLADLTITRETQDDQGLFRYDSGLDVYLVKGLNKEDLASLATINRDDTISIVLDTSTGDGTYNRLVIETYNPLDPIYGAATDTRISLYSDATFDKDNPMAQADASGSYDIIDVGNDQGFAPGTYYIKVVPSPNAIGNTGPYAIRALVNPGDPLPAYVTFLSTNDSDSPYEPDGAVDTIGKPTNPVVIKINQSLNRYLSSATDADWFVLDLQEVVVPPPK
jgi:hypothetical protein